MTLEKLNQAIAIAEELANEWKADLSCQIYQAADTALYRLKLAREAMETYERYGYVVADGNRLRTKIYNCDCYLCTWSKKSRILNSERQPKEGDRILAICFPTGAYIFNNDYDDETMEEFLGELRKFKPDFEDSLNSNMYWYAERGTEVYKALYDIYDKYRDIAKSRSADNAKRKIRSQIEKLENDLRELEGNEE